MFILRFNNFVPIIILHDFIEKRNTVLLMFNIVIICIFKYFQKLLLSSNCCKCSFNL